MISLRLSLDQKSSMEHKGKIYRNIYNEQISKKKFITFLTCVNHQNYSKLLEHYQFFLLSNFIIRNIKKIKQKKTFQKGEKGGQTNQINLNK